jgi:hypothetical protein
MALPGLTLEENDLVDELIAKFERVHLNTLQSITAHRLRSQLWKQEISQAFDEARGHTDRDSLVLAHLFSRLLYEGIL